MSEIEIPKEFKAAWQVCNGSNYYRPAKLADALVWALASWMRSEFYHIHAQHEFNCRVFECHTKADPRHTWTDPDWEKAARARLEEQ